MPYRQPGPGSASLSPEPLCLLCYWVSAVLTFLHGQIHRKVQAKACAWAYALPYTRTLIHALAHCIHTALECKLLWGCVLPSTKKGPNPDTSLNILFPSFFLFFFFLGVIFSLKFSSFLPSSSVVGATRPGRSLLLSCFSSLSHQTKWLFPQEDLFQLISECYVYFFFALQQHILIDQSFSWIFVRIASLLIYGMNFR